MSDKENKVWSPTLLSQEELVAPLKWERECRIRIEGDIFAPRIPDAIRHQIFAVMAITPHHQYRATTWYPKETCQFFTMDYKDWLTRPIQGEVLNILRDEKDPLKWKYNVTSIHVQIPLPNLTIALVLDEVTEEHYHEFINLPNTECLT